SDLSFISAFSIMSSFDSLPAEILEIISEQLPHTDKISFSQVSRLFRHIAHRFVIQELKLFLIEDVTISTSSLDRSMTCVFFSPHSHAMKTWKGPASEPGEVYCYRTFAFSPTNSYSFFGAAKIGHLEMNKTLPITLGGKNLSHLTSLLSGCSIDKITLLQRYHST
ncbi:hypothetical protein PENTCL1PPCAC_26121, partial [Pristionchus entomophagus]